MHCTFKCFNSVLKYIFNESEKHNMTIVIRFIRYDKVDDLFKKMVYKFESA